MMRALIALFTILALATFSGEARASACSTDAYMHNGSLMEVQICDGGALTISYTQPRPGMAKAPDGHNEAFLVQLPEPGGFGLLFVLAAAALRRRA